MSGPNRFTRDPLYLGNLVQAAGKGMLGPWPGLAILTALMLAYCFVSISVEEPYLNRKKGAVRRLSRKGSSIVFRCPCELRRAPASTDLGARAFSQITCRPASPSSPISLDQAFA